LFKFDKKKNYSQIICVSPNFMHFVWITYAIYFFHCNRFISCLRHEIALLLAYFHLHHNNGLKKKTIDFGLLFGHVQLLFIVVWEDGISIKLFSSCAPQKECQKLIKEIGFSLIVYRVIKSWVVFLISRQDFTEIKENPKWAKL
jgi:hypothetical protein